jgi:hypothetical protein
MSSKYSHPAASCRTANKLYWQWAHMTEELPLKHHDCQDAKARYQLHLWDCDVCRENIDVNEP